MSGKLLDTVVVLLCTVIILNDVCVCDDDDEGRYRVCGSDLRRLVTMVCRGCIYNSKEHIDKRSDSLQNYFRALDIVTNNRKRTATAHGGIVDECCYSTCTMSTLKTYCCAEDY